MREEGAIFNRNFKLLLNKQKLIIYYLLQINKKNY